jgi:site-specific recombinase XerD
MQKEEHIVKNPINKVEKIKERKKPKYAFTDMDIEKMRLQIGDNLMLRCMFEMFLSTWCRVSELANMKISEITPDLESVTVHGKGNKDRKCYINETAKLYLQKYISERKDDNDYLFPSSINEGKTAAAFPTRTLQKECAKRHLKQYDWWKIPKLIGEGHKDIAIIERYIRQLGKKAGVEKAHPHRFRRTGATFALRKGMPIEIVSKLLGHESIETTQIYLDVSEDSLEQFHRKYV